LAKTSASRIAPAPVNSQPRIEMGPAAEASVAGSRKMPEPIMLPTTSAVAIQRPIERFSFGAGARSAPEVSRVISLLLVDANSDGECSAAGRAVPSVLSAPRTASCPPLVCGQLRTKASG
jgi:hypothetical protein